MDPVASYDFGARGCTDGVSTEFKQHIGEVEIGQSIEVFVRDASARTDLPAMCRMLGHDIIEQDDAGGVLRLRIRRGR